MLNVQYLFANFIHLIREAMFCRFFSSAGCSCFLHVLLTFVLFFGGISFCSAQSLFPDARQAEIWQKEIYHGASLSFHAIDLHSGKELLNHNSRTSLIPASALKMLTVAAAVQVLPPGQQFSNVWYGQGHLKGNTWHGDLIFQGSGDPTTGSRYATESAADMLNNLATVLQEAGIKNVTGRVLADVRCCSDHWIADTWPWYDIGNYYGIGAGCINWRDNSYDLIFDRKADRVDITGTDPFVPGLHHKADVKAEGRRDLAYIYGGPGQYHRKVRGSIPAGSGRFVIRGSLPDPARQFAFELYQSLVSCGIKIEGGYDVIDEYYESVPKQPMIFRDTRTDMRSLLPRIMEDSDNLYAEALFLQTSQHLGGDCDLSGASRAIQEYWQRELGTFPGMTILDGSGLSPRNAVSSAMLTEVLSRIYRQHTIREEFVRSFPVAGVSGTVRNWMRNRPAGWEIRVKSGSMGRVQAYAGYAIHRNGRVIVFSMIANNFEGNNMQVRNDMEQLLREVLN